MARIELPCLQSSILRHREAQARYRTRLSQRRAPDSEALCRAALAGLQLGVAEASARGRRPEDVPELSRAVRGALATLVDRGYCQEEARRRLMRVLRPAERTHTKASDLA